MSDVLCQTIGHEQTWPLRQLVLRPGQPVSACRWEGDELATTHHYGAFRSGDLLAIASLYQRPHAVAPSPNAWQLRGMATHPDCRGEGLGAAILAFLLEDCRERLGGRIVWCNARTSAVGFYAGRGFATIGDEFQIEGIGPHFVMYRQL